MKIYTRKGDSGQTGIWGGRRWARTMFAWKLSAPSTSATRPSVRSLAAGLPGTLSSVLVTAQGRLFIVGSELMAPEHAGSGGGLPRPGDQDVTELETAIDSLEQDLPELRDFILPGGTPAAAALHLARGVCRRAERRVAALSRAEGARPAPRLHISTG